MYTLLTMTDETLYALIRKVTVSDEKLYTLFIKVTKISMKSIGTNWSNSNI